MTKRDRLFNLYKRFGRARRKCDFYQAKMDDIEKKIKQLVNTMKKKSTT